MYHRSAQTATVVGCRILHRMRTYLGIVAALEPEAALVRRNLGMVRKTVHETGTLWQGEWCDQPVALLRCGMGAQRSTVAVTWLVQHCPLWGVVSIGFAGALHQRMATGDAVLVSRVYRLHPDRAEAPWCPEDAIATDSGLAHTAKLAAAEAALVPHEGTLLSVPAVVTTSTAKRQLGQRSGALAVDMESYGIAGVAKSHHLPFLPLRTIFDTIADELALPAERFTTPDGALKPGSLAWYGLRHPSVLASLPHLWYTARVASRNLESWLRHFLTMLDQPSASGASEGR